MSSSTPCAASSGTTRCSASPSRRRCPATSTRSHTWPSRDVDYFGIGNGDYDSLDLLMPTLDYEPGFGVPFARAVKQAVPDAAVLAEGRITRPEIGERALAEGSCDLVGMTRAQIADPELVRKAAAGTRTKFANASA